ncbi:hypothetical protein D3C85_1875290 [compost metagenome]
MTRYASISRSSISHRLQFKTRETFAKAVDLVLVLVGQFCDVVKMNPVAVLCGNANHAAFLVFTAAPEVEARQFMNFVP